MEFIDNLLPQIQSLIERFMTVESGIQLMTVVGCGLLAALTYKRCQKIITKVLDGLEN